MTIQINSLTELLKIFSGDATVRGFEEGITMKNADGSGEIILMNDNFPAPDAAEMNRNHSTPPDGASPQDALEATDPTDRHKIRLVPRNPHGK